MFVLMNACGVSASPDMTFVVDWVLKNPIIFVVCNVLFKNLVNLNTFLIPCFFYQGHCAVGVFLGLHHDAVSGRLPQRSNWRWCGLAHRGLPVVHDYLLDAPAGLPVHRQAHLPLHCGAVTGYAGHLPRYGSHHVHWRDHACYTVLSN